MFGGRIKMKTIFDYTDYRQYLKDYYEYRKKENKSISHRYFEQRLQVSEGYFSRILKGEKNVSDVLLVRFTQILKLSKKEAEYFENMVKFTLAQDGRSRGYYYDKMLERGRRKISSLTIDQYELFQESLHLLVHALVNMLIIRPDMDLGKVGQMLTPPVPASRIRESLELLSTLGLIGLNEHGNYVVVKRILSTGCNPKDVTLRRFTKKSLVTASDLLDVLPLQERSVAIMTVSISPETYEKILEKLNSVRQEINNLIAQDRDMDRIYQIGMYVVPLCKKIRKESK
jgi:uncharacterized protein (TIGR02147 family)